MGDAEPEEEPALEPGTLVGERYRVLALLGRGGMGAVYEAEHVSLGRRVALKTLLPALGRVPELAARFEREARAQSQLQHPGIVSVSDFGVTPTGALFYAMELVRGRSLGEELDEHGALPPATAVRLIRRVLEPLGFAHKHGVVHRDLKPDNVMRLTVGEGEDPDQIKLVDFGIAKILGETEGDALTKAGVAFGTPDYMAPEQALGEAVDGRADLYSLGAILFELLTGRKVFVSGDKLAVVRMHVAVAPPTLAEAGRPVVPQLEAAVARFLAKERAARFADAAEADRALAEAERALATEAAGAAPVAYARTAAAMPAQTGTSPTSAAGSPWPRRLALGGALLVAAVMTATLVTSGGKPAPGRSRLTAPLGPTVLAPSALTREATAKLEAGDALGASAAVEAAGAAGKGDAGAQAVLGRALVARGLDADALAAFERAVAITPQALDDDRVLKAVAALVGRKDRAIALLALELLARHGGAAGRPMIVDVASYGRARDVRLRARTIAERDGYLDRVDRLESYALDLVDGKSCTERRAAIAPLVALRDPKAIPYLKKAKGRSGGLFGLEDVNDCLAKDAQAAIDSLGGGK